MEQTRQDSLGTPPSADESRAAGGPARPAPQPLHTAPEAAQLGQMTQLAQYIVQQARDTAATLDRHTQETLAQAKADARELLRKAEQQASEIAREARSYSETVLADAKKLAQQERDLGDAWALQIRATAKAEAESLRTVAQNEAEAMRSVAQNEAEAMRTSARAEAEAQRKQSQEQQAIERRELERLQRLVTELRAEGTTAYEGAMKARATIDAAARAEFELRTKELTNLHTVVQTTTDLAKQVIKPSEPKTSSTEVIGGVVSQFIQSAQSVFEKAIEKSPGVQQLVGEVAQRGRQIMGSAPPEGVGSPGLGDPDAVASAQPVGSESEQARAAQAAQDEVDLELLRVAADLRADQIPEEVLQRLCQARYGHTDLTKLTFRDLNAAAYLFLSEQRKGAAS